MFSGHDTALTLDDDAVMILLFQLLFTYVAHSSHQSLYPHQTGGPGAYWAIYVYRGNPDKE